MHQDVFFPLLLTLDKVDASIEKAFDILVLRVFEEKSQIRNASPFKPVFTVISCAVYYCFYVVFLESFPVFCHLFPRHKNTVKYFVALRFKLLHFQLVTGCCADVELNLSSLLLLLYLRVTHLFEGF